MSLFKKKSTIDWESKYKDLVDSYDKLYEKNRELKNNVKLLEARIKKTGYLEPKERKITDEEILYIKTLRAKEGLSYSYITKETGWSKSTVCRVLNGVYDLK